MWIVERLLVNLYYLVVVDSIVTKKEINERDVYGIHLQ